MCVWGGGGGGEGGTLTYFCSGVNLSVKSNNLCKDSGAAEYQSKKNSKSNGLDWEWFHPSRELLWLLYWISWAQVPVLSLVLQFCKGAIIMINIFTQILWDSQSAETQIRHQRI